MALPVLLASYMKSGNTWLRLLLDSLLRGGGEVDINQVASGSGSADREWFDRAMMVDSSSLTPAEIAGARAGLTFTAEKPHLFLKAHDANLPYPGTGAKPYASEAISRVVHLVRDPRDVAVSFASHAAIAIDSAIERMADRDYIIGRQSFRLADQLPQFVSSWTQHTASWIGAPGFVTMTLRYEDLLADTPGHLAEVAQFLGLDAPTVAVERAVAAARFEQLRDQELNEGFRERPLNAERFFRRGIAGGWRDTLTAEQARRIEYEHGGMMQRLGYFPG